MLFPLPGREKARRDQGREKQGGIVAKHGTWGQALRAKILALSSVYHYKVIVVIQIVSEPEFSNCFHLG